MTKRYRRPKDPNSVEGLRWDFWAKHSLFSGTKEYKAKPEAKYLIYPFLHENQKMICVAPSGSGKSIVGLSIASALALGNDRTLFKYWKFPNRARVLYLQFDMPTELFYRRYAPLNTKLMGLKNNTELNQYLTVLCRDEIRKKFGAIRSFKNLEQWRIFLKLTSPDIVFIDNIAAMPGGLKAFATNSEEFNQFLDLFEEMHTAVFIQHHTNTSGKEYGGIINHTRMDFAILASRPKDWVRRDGISLKIRYAKDRSDPNAELPSVHISINQGKWQTIEIEDQKDYLEKAKEKLVVALKAATGKGLNKRDIFLKVFNNNVPIEVVNDVIADLLSEKKIVVEKAIKKKGFRFYDPAHAPQPAAATHAPHGTVI